MSRLLIVSAVLILLWLGLRWFIRTPPAQVRRTLRYAALAALLLGLGFLAATGRLNWMVAAGAALLPFLRRAFTLIRFLPLFQSLLGRYQTARAQRPPKSGQQSTVESRFLRMTLDHDSGDMDGEVLEGRFADRLLSQMILAELLDLRDECRRLDGESAALLEAYLDRCHADWRAQPDTGADSAPHSAPPPAGGPAMSPEEARDILGVGADASAQDIIQAHRRLMHKLHPDRGGSDYLAAKINLAKDCLLGK